MNIPNYTYVTHKLISRPWGQECRFTVKNANGKFIDDVVPIKSMAVEESELVDTISKRLALWKEAEDREAITYHFFDHVGPEIKEALFWLIRKIRQYPNATYAQAETQWNEEWADSLFTFAKLTAYIQNRIKANITWANFKTYVINHYFEGLD